MVSENNYHYWQKAQEPIRTVKDLLKTWLGASPLHTHKLAEAQLKETWRAVMGEKVASRTERIYLPRMEAMLHIQINSRALLSELIGQRVEIEAEIRKALPELRFSKIFWL
jgi:hypothetical protein